MPIYKHIVPNNNDGTLDLPVATGRASDDVKRNQKVDD